MRAIRLGRSRWEFACGSDTTRRKTRRAACFGGLVGAAVAAKLLWGLGLRLVGQGGFEPPTT